MVGRGSARFNWRGCRELVRLRSRCRALCDLCVTSAISAVQARPPLPWREEDDVMRTGLLLVACQLAAIPAAAETFDLPATPASVAWGNYDAAHALALMVKSGDTLLSHTLLTNSPTGLERSRVPPDQVEASLRAVYAGVT